MQLFVNTKGAGRIKPQPGFQKVRTVLGNLAVTRVIKAIVRGERAFARGDFAAFRHHKFQEYKGKRSRWLRGA